MLAHLTVLAAMVLGASFLRALRRDGRRGQSLIVGATLALALAGLARGVPALCVAAIAFTLLAVVLPAGLELAVRAAFARGYLALAVRMSAVRVLLMPGAGLGRQQAILEGLALLEQDGVEAALRHFRRLADEVEDVGERALIDEQIVSMLLYGHRWDEGIAHYEARFHPRYAAVRPALALGMLRAYGEAGRIDTAAGLLRAIEDGPMGADPRALSFLSQARLTFLAYVGAAAPVDEALRPDHERALGISPASAAFLRGVAWHRAGERSRAEVELRSVGALAGRGDARLVDASKAAIARLDAEPVTLDEELRAYVTTVASRLTGFLQVAPRLRRTGRLVVAPALILGVAAAYFAALWIGRGAYGWLELGAMTPELWASGSWWRLLAGAFTTGDPIAALLDAYALWLSAPLVERVLGRGRLALVAFGGAAAGATVGAMRPLAPALLVPGADLMAIAVTVAALVTLLPLRTPGLSRRSRRSLALPLVLVLAVQGLAAGRGLLAFDAGTGAFGAAVLVGAMLVLLAGAIGPFARVLAVCAWPIALALPIAFAMVTREDALAIVTAGRTGFDSNGVRVRLPSTFASTDRFADPALPLALQAAPTDELALRGGAVVQLVTAPKTVGDTDAAIVRIDAKLLRELDAIDAEVPPKFAAACEAAGLDPAELNAHGLRRAGDRVAISIARTIATDAGLVEVALVAAPPSALDGAPTLYADILASARPSE